MTTKRWQAGLAMLVMAVGLWANAMPAAGGQLAQWVYYPGAVDGDPTGGLTMLDDGKTLDLQANQYVVVALPTPLTSSSWPNPDIRIHMSGESSSPFAAVGNAVYDWMGWSGSWLPYGDSVPIQSDFDFSVKVAQDNLTALYYPNATPTHTTITYVKIYNSLGVLKIDGVEVLAGNPVAMINTLVAKVATFNLQQGIDNSLDTKLNAALLALDDLNANNDASAVNRLQAFINEVEAQRGQKITDAQAAQLEGDAQAIVTALTGA